MENLIKLPSLQASFDRSGTKQLVDLEIPRGIGKVDLSRCEVIINLQGLGDPTASAALAGGPAVMDVFIKQNNKGDQGGVAFVGGNGVDSIVSSDPAVIIKNASLMSSTRGKIEDLRDVQSLRGNLARYMRNETDIDSRKGMPTGSGQLRQSIVASRQNELVGLGNEKSRQKSMDYRIPLKDIFDFCHNPGFDTSNDSLKIHIEFHFNRIVTSERAVNNIFGVNGFYNRRTRNDATDHFLNQIDVPAGNQGVNGTAGNVALTDPLITTSSYPDLKYSPFFVGQQIAVMMDHSANGLAGGGGAAEAVTAGGAQVAFNTITAINYSGNTDKLALTLSNDNTLLLPAGQRVRTDAVNDAQGVNRRRGVRVALDAVSTAFGGGGAANNQFVQLQNQGVDINSVELSVQVDPDAVAPSPFVYTTYLSERDSYAPRNRFVRNYEIPPNCRNVYVFFSPEEQVSMEKQLASYRVSIDGVDILGRSVSSGSPLDLDLKTTTIANSGEKLRSLVERTMTIYGTSVDNTDGGVKYECIMFPCPLKQNSQRLTLDLQAGATDAAPALPTLGQAGGAGSGGAANNNRSGEHIIYYECLKQM